MPVAAESWSAMVVSCQEYNISQHLSLLLWLLHSLWPLFCSISWVLGEFIYTFQLGLNIYQLLITITLSSAEHRHWLLMSAKRSSLPKLRIALTYEYNHKYLLGSLTMWPFSKTNSSGFLFKAHDLPSMGFYLDLQYYAWMFLCRRPQNLSESAWRPP